MTAEPTGHKKLLAEITAEKERIADLQSEIDARRARLEALRCELSAISSEQMELKLSARPPALPFTLPPAPPPATNAEKLALFRSLFRGREDVFPRRWENPRTGKSGYAPACSNEWVHGLCAKGKDRPAGRKAACSDCKHRDFLPVTDEEMAKHLRGRQVMGVYPLLPDETCQLLAVDFDGQSWREDVAAFVVTCKEHGSPAAVERSRSGNGAHGWFFFAAPVSAASARKMGCFFITETMVRRHQLAIESYDRLFPNQDTLPKGGFGNLIALPLQRKARSEGNTVFVDDAFESYPDQWAFLANLPRVEPSFVEDAAAEAARLGRVVGVRAVDLDGESDAKPWNMPAFCREGPVTMTDPLPREVRAVLCQRLFVEKAGLPSPLVDRIKRLAAFQNPEFYKKQSMRLSTALTPRIISCAEEFPDHVALPRGCLPEVKSLLDECGAALVVDDAREEGLPLGLEFQGRLAPLQERAAEALLEHETGVLVAPPGAGKTVIGAFLVAARGTSTLVLVHRKPLLEQWVAQLALFLGLEPKDIGRVGAGFRKPNGRLDVAMIQSLVRKGQTDDSLGSYGHVIVDECHHVPAVSFERVLASVKARFVAGLTATPRRRDGQHPILHMQLGPVRFAVDARNRAARSVARLRLVVRDTGFDPAMLPSSAGIQEIYAALAADSARNELIFEDVIRALEEKRSPLLLTERRDHLERLADLFRGMTRNLVVLHGRATPKQRRETSRRLAAIPAGEERLILATGRYIGEGFDDARLDTLFLALPVSWKGTLVQYAGRLQRARAGKSEARIYDYVDRAVPVLRGMFEKRLRGYRAIGFVNAQAP